MCGFQALSCESGVSRMAHLDPPAARDTAHRGLMPLNFQYHKRFHSHLRVVQPLINKVIRPYDCNVISEEIIDIIQWFQKEIRSSSFRCDISLVDLIHLKFSFQIRI